MNNDQLNKSNTSLQTNKHSRATAIPPYSHTGQPVLGWHPQLTTDLAGGKLYGPYATANDN